MRNLQDYETDIPWETLQSYTDATLKQLSTDQFVIGIRHLETT